MSTETRHRDSLVAGASRADRFGGASNRTRNRTTTLRAIQLSDKKSPVRGGGAGGKNSRRDSEALPFDEEDAAFQNDTSIAEDQPSASPSQRSTRSSARKSNSPKARSPSPSPAPAAAAAAASSSPRSPATPAKTRRRAAASTSKQQQQNGASTPATAAGRRRKIHQPFDNRISFGYTPPFARSRAQSMANTPAGAREDGEDAADGDDPMNTSPLKLTSDDGDAEMTDPSSHDFDVGGGGNDDDEENEPADPPSHHDEEETKENNDSTSSSPSKTSPEGKRGKKRKDAPLPPKQPRATGGGRVGRKTFAIIERARNLGVIPEDDEEPEEGARGPPGKRLRPTRECTAPIEWWRGEQPNYVRVKDSMGEVLPILDPENPYIHVAAPSPQPKRPSRPPSKVPKHHGVPTASAAATAAAVAAATAALREDDDTSKYDELEKKAKILDPTGRELVVGGLALHTHKIPLEKLAGESGANTPHGSKIFEMPEFSSGILSLPPRAKKQREVAANNEVFYVISGPPNALSWTLRDVTQRLSKGTQFMVPAGNTYELHNSSNKTVKMMFVLVRPAAMWMSECREQLEAEREVEEQQQQDEDEQSEEEEVRRPTRRSISSKGSGQKKRK